MILLDLKEDYKLLRWMACRRVPIKAILYDYRRYEEINLQVRRSRE